MGERFLAMVNPAAGGGRCGRQAPAVLEELRAAGLDLEVATTAAPGDATRLARAAYAAGVRHFVAVGGDGTSFEVVNGLFPEALGAAEPPTLGFLPLGTGNSFLHDFAIEMGTLGGFPSPPAPAPAGRSPTGAHATPPARAPAGRSPTGAHATDGAEGAAHARQALLAGTRRACDVLRLHHREGDLYFINLLSFGFVADVCTLTNRRFKAFGAAGYGFGVVAKTTTLKCRPIPIAVDGGEREDEPRAFIALCNSRFTGGTMMMAPDADPADGSLDLITVGRLGRWGLLRTFPKIFKGTHLENPAVTARRARVVEFMLEGPADAMIDGEVITLWPERVDVLPGALRVRA